MEVMKSQDLTDITMLGVRGNSPDLLINILQGSYDVLLVRA